MPEIYLCLSVKKKLKSFWQNISPILENADRLGGQQVAFSETKWMSGQINEEKGKQAGAELCQAQLKLG